MAEDKQEEKKEEKQTGNSQKQESKQEIVKAPKKPVTDTKKTEEKKESKKEEKKTESKGPKKTEAVVNGRSLPISTKYAVAICNYIRNKDVDTAISMLEEVEKKKRAIPMKGEIPHKKGIMSGKYPVKATNEFIKLLKSLKANAVANELELEKYKLFCMANVAARPYRRFGRTRFKRSHVTLKLIKSKKSKKPITHQNKSEDKQSVPKLNVNDKQKK